MTILHIFGLFFLLITPPAAAAASPALCSPAWTQSIAKLVQTDDGKGHGPDVGSDEWKSVVEFRLGVRDTKGFPARDSEAWCQRIEQLAGTPQKPAYDCSKRSGSVELMVCRNEELAALDRRMAGIYAAALRKAKNEHPPVLRAEQRGWVKGRNDCWKGKDVRACVKDSYVHRIAELQARYRLVGFTGPVRWACNGNPRDELIVTFFKTDPTTLIAERGDSTSLMYQQPAASGTKYVGRNESFWEHQGEATVVWGYGAPEMRCRVSP